MNNTQQEEPRQPWHKPEVTAVDMEETLASFGFGNDGNTKTSNT